uniref:Activin types I and II receptor domain-containing protein n=1 Tax=Parascaris equorum TaxID=6256 RepID=A0A914S251_PAREQ
MKKGTFMIVKVGTPTSDGTPEMDNMNEANIVNPCLMLDHAVTGIHYACSQSDLPDGKCEERTTKSGVAVNVCACNSDDFCNYKNWPMKKVEPELVSDNIITPITITANAASIIVPFFAILIPIFFIANFYAFPRT